MKITAKELSLPIYLCVIILVLLLYYINITGKYLPIENGFYKATIHYKNNFTPLNLLCDNKEYYIIITRDNAEKYLLYDVPDKASNNADKKIVLNNLEYCIIMDNIESMYWEYAAKEPISDILKDTTSTEYKQLQITPLNMSITQTKTAKNTLFKLLVILQAEFIIYIHKCPWAVVLLLVLICLPIINTVKRKKGEIKCKK